MLRRAASTLPPLLLAAAAFAPIALTLTPRAVAGNNFPRGEPAVGYGAGALADPGPGCPGCRAWPYCTSSCVYGYQDYSYGRGPLINLGGASLQPGFRGYGALGSIGYGQGMYPATWITQEKRWGWWLKPSAWHRGPSGYRQDGAAPGNAAAAAAGYGAAPPPPPAPPLP